MANVLPQEAQKKVSSFFRARFILAGSLVLLVAALVALLALLPAYAVLYIGKTSVSEGIVQTALPAGAQDKKDREDILRAQLLMENLSSVASSTTSGLEVLQAVLDKRPKGVVLEDISYAAGEAGTIQIGGVASTREGISAYAASLRSDPRFKSVSVPIGDLTGAGDGHFTITLTGAF